MVADLVLASHTPHGEADVLVLSNHYAETSGGNGDCCNKLQLYRILVLPSRPIVRMCVAFLFLYPPPPQKALEEVCNDIYHASIQKETSAKTAQNQALDSLQQDGGVLSILTCSEWLSTVLGGKKR